MTKHCMLGTFLSLGLCATATADATAKKKVDDVKTETCEKTKKFLADKAAQGRCKDESAAAQKITCSESTFKEVTDLNTKCARTPVKGDKPTPKCRALVDGKAIAEVEDASSVACAGKLQDAVRAAKCTTADMKNKKVEYTISSEHKVGTSAIKDRVTSLTCLKISSR